MPQVTKSLTLRNYPLGTHLVNAGPHALSPEQSLWEAQNASTDFAGRVEKRKGLKQWGQSLKEPRTGDMSYIEVFNDLSNFNVDTATAGTDVIHQLKNNQLKLETTGTSAGTNFINIQRLFQPSDDTAADNDISVRFFMRAITTLPTNPGGGNDYGPSVVISDGTGADYSFLFLNTGIHYKANATSLYTLIPNTDIDDKKWHMIEIRIDSATATAILKIDDGADLPATAAMDDITALISLIDNRQIMFRARTNATSTYEVEFDFVQGRGGDPTDAFVGTPIRQEFDWRSFVPLRRHLLVVAGSTIYRDTGHATTFFALDTLPAGTNIQLISFQDELIILTENQPMRRWTGSGAPEIISGTLNNAPQGSIGVEHLSRLFVIDENDPLRVHFSGVSDLDDWTTVDVAGTDSGNFLVPNRLGERVTAMFGNYYGRLYIGTKTSLHQVTGTDFSPGSSNFIVDTVSESLGVVGPQAITLAGNDLQFLSEQGLHSLLRTQKFGDVETEFLSAPIRLRWAKDTQVNIRKIQNHFNSVVAYHPERHRTYMAVAVEGDSTPARIFELNNTTGSWTGPNDIATRGLIYIRLSTPAFPTMMYGDSSGRVVYIDNDSRSDFGSGYSLRMRSARLDGRSLSPELVGMGKTWQELRLFVQPRGEWDINVSWETDESRPDNTDRTQNPDKDDDLDSGTVTTPTGDGSFVLDESKLVDEEKVVVLTYRLDTPGRWLQFTIEQANDAEDASILGWQIDFIPSKVLQEDTA